MREGEVSLTHSARRYRAPTSAIIREQRSQWHSPLEAPGGGGSQAPAESGAKEASLRNRWTQSEVKRSWTLTEEGQWGGG